MAIVRLSCITATLLSFSLLFSGSVIAKDLIDPSRNVFTFQKKLAAKGDERALFKLGYMYEMGEGTDLNLTEAKKCYQGAAAKGYSPANLRLVYFDVKANGYDKEKNAGWLHTVKGQSSGTGEASLEALFLLGQLYREGLGVNKDLQKSLEIMYQLGMEGIAAADVEISKIEAEIAAKQRKKALNDTRRADSALARKRAKEAAEAEKRKTAVKKPPVEKSATAIPTPEFDEKTLKRKRYEAVMKKLAEEKALIDALQGGEADDEI